LPIKKGRLPGLYAGKPCPREKSIVKHKKAESKIGSWDHFDLLFCYLYRFKFRNKAALFCTGKQVKAYLFLDRIPVLERVGILSFGLQMAIYGTSLCHFSAP